MNVGSPPGTGHAKTQGDGVMNFVKQRESARIEKSAEVELEGKIHELARRESALSRTDGDSELATYNLSTLFRRVSVNSTSEIDNLISELQTLREKLRADGDRVERDIVEYAARSQSVVEMTRIISESMMQVKKISKAPTISG